MQRLSITDAAVYLALSPDTIRRRIRKGELTAQRDNKGQWFVDLADDVPPASGIGSIGNASIAPPNAHMHLPGHAPMQVPDIAIADALRSEAVALRNQVADLAVRLDRAESREAELRLQLERQGRELTAALLRTAIAETEARTLREALTEARRPAWRRWLGLT